MIGIIVILIISWALLWIFSKQHISVIGITPSFLRVKELFIALFFTVMVSSMDQLGQAFLKEIEYTLNDNYQWQSFMESLWWILKSVLFEELIFRGAILYLLIRKMGIKSACIIDAIAFGIYHWFSYGMFGGPIVPMIYIFLLTGAAGWMFAYAFAKTKSIYAPIGLHLGWNIASIIIFSNGPIGDQMLISANTPIETNLWHTLIIFLFQIVTAPLLVTWYLSKRKTHA